MSVEMQELIVAVIVMLVAQVVKVLAANGGVKITKLWVSVGVFVLACVLGAAMTPWIKPSVVSAEEIIRTVFSYAGAVLGIATLFYNLLFSKIFEKIKMDPNVILEDKAKQDLPF